MGDRYDFQKSSAHVLTNGYEFDTIIRAMNVLIKGPVIVKGSRHHSMSGHDLLTGVCLNHDGVHAR